MSCWRLTFGISEGLSTHKSSIYGQLGWWMGNPSEWASGVEYQSCHLWGETSTAVETPWCQRHARYSVTSQIGLDTLTKGDCGQHWWKLIFTCVIAVTLRTHYPHKPCRVLVSPNVNRCHGDSSQSSAATSVNVNMRTWKQPKSLGCFSVWLCLHAHWSDGCM